MTQPAHDATSLRSEYERRAKEVAEAIERSVVMERDFLESQVLNRDANVACADSLQKRREFAAWLMKHHAELFAASIPSAIPAISASGNYPLKFFGSPGPIGTCMGIEIHADRAVPDHTIEVRDSINGRLLGRIINVG